MSEEDVDDVNMDVDDNNDDWRTFILITGRPGSGKSQIMNRTIQKCIEEGRNILATAPTGILASCYKKSFQPHIHRHRVYYSHPKRNSYTSNCITRWRSTATTTDREHRREDNSS